MDKLLGTNRLAASLRLTVKRIMLNYIANNFRQSLPTAQSSIMLSSKFLPGLVSVLAWLTLRTVGLAQELPSGLHRIEHAAIRGATIYRGERRLYVVPVELTEGGSMIIPRMFSSIRSIGWSNSEKTVPIELQPEPET